MAAHGAPAVVSCPAMPPARPHLPIDDHRDAILDALRAHPVVVVAGDTGSGKTTQIPQYCLDLGLPESKLIGCTQPRRVAAVSVGLLNGEVLLDLCYTEDSAADVDMNIVMTDKGRFVEIQGSGEEATFSEKQMGEMIKAAKHGLKEIFDLQEKALKQK